MKVVEYQSYGAPEVLQVIEVEKPEPKGNEVLIKLYATTVTSTECTFRKGEPYFSRLFTGLSKPKIKRLGEELSGTIVAVGESVKGFKVGDEVFGTAGPKFGANAEYMCLPDDAVIVLKPSNLDFAEAASGVDGFLTSLPFLRDKGNITANQNVLVYGASGSVGSAAVQIAKYYEASVTAVCSTGNVMFVKSIGADHVVDYTKEDFSKLDRRYDIIFDAVGKTSFPKCKRLLTTQGVFLEAGITLGIFKYVIWTSLFGRKKARIAATGLRAPNDRLKDLKLLKVLMEENRIKPTIDKRYFMGQLAEAHRYVDKGHKQGNVVILIEKKE